MNIQDRLERILRELHIIVSRAPVSEINRDYVMVPKKEMQMQLGSLSQIVREMMDQYEVTMQSRSRMEREAENHRMDIVRNANHQAQDIYAASVIYSEDALGRIQDIINEAQQSAKETLKRMVQEMEEEKRTVRSNQVELLSYLEDMNDTAKYMRLIEERNREISKAKAKKQEKERSKGYQRKREKDPDFHAVTPEIKVNEEHLRKIGMMPEESPEEELLEETGEPEALEEEAPENVEDESVTYEKPVIKINKEYFKKAGIPLDEEPEGEGAAEEETENSGFRLFGRRS